MEQEDQEISRQLAMSKPLVTEMLEFLNSKSNQGEATSEMTKLMYDIQASLKECIQQAHVFTKSAHYDSSAANKPFQSLKQGGGRNVAGMGGKEFEEMMGMDIHHANHGQDNESPSISIGMPVGIG